jgi:hypothetical protein
LEQDELRRAFLEDRSERLDNVLNRPHLAGFLRQFTPAA